MDLRWLAAPDHEVAAEMARFRRESRPGWVPNKRQVLVHVTHCLLLWYLFFLFMSIGIQVDAYQGGTLGPADIAGLLINLPIVIAAVFAVIALHRWAARPPSPRARLQQWRCLLTARANGLASRPSPRATFDAVVTTAARGVREYPRFVAPGVEFGNLVRRHNRTAPWHYIAIALPAPLPHLLLDAQDRRSGELSADVDRGQRLSLEGDFDRWFRAFSPAAYAADALYVLTPELMAALIDHAAGFNVEFVDDRLVFFAAGDADFSQPEAWQTVRGIFDEIAPRVAAKAGRYRDERVPGQDLPSVLERLRANRVHPARESLETLLTPTARRIGADGRRLAIRRHDIRYVVGAIGWVLALIVLYVFPGLFAFAGFMSIVDGR